MKLINPACFESDLFINDKLTRMDLKRIRKSRHMTCKDISEISGLSQGSINSLESANDEVQTPTLRTISKYLNALGYDMYFKPKD